jgi:hypothetical protein
LIHQGQFCCGGNLSRPRGAAYPKTLRGFGWNQLYPTIFGRKQLNALLFLYPTKWREMLVSKKRWLCSLLSNVVFMYKCISFYLRLHWQQQPQTIGVRSFHLLTYHLLDSWDNKGGRDRPILSYISLMLRPSISARTPRSGREHPSGPNINVLAASLHSVRLSYKPYFSSQRIIFFLITNQRTILSAMTFQPSEQGASLQLIPLPNSSVCVSSRTFPTLRPSRLLSLRRLPQRPCPPCLRP